MVVDIEICLTRLCFIRRCLVGKICLAFSIDTRMVVSGPPKAIFCLQIDAAAVRQ